MGKIVCIFVVLPWAAVGEIQSSHYMYCRFWQYLLKYLNADCRVMHWQD